MVPAKLRDLLGKTRAAPVADHASGSASSPSASARPTRRSRARRSSRKREPPPRRGRPALGRRGGAELAAGSAPPPPPPAGLRRRRHARRRGRRRRQRPADRHARGAASARRLLRADTDGDGMEDGWEYQSAVDLNAGSCPGRADHRRPRALRRRKPYPAQAPVPEPARRRDAARLRRRRLPACEESRAWKRKARPTPPATSTTMWYSDGKQASIDELGRRRLPRHDRGAITVRRRPRTRASPSRGPGDLLADAPAAPASTAESELRPRTPTPTAASTTASATRTATSCRNVEELARPMSAPARGGAASSTSRCTGSRTPAPTGSTPTPTATASSTRSTTRTTTTSGTSRSSSAAARAPTSDGFDRTSAPACGSTRSTPACRPSVADLPDRSPAGQPVAWRRTAPKDARCPALAAVPQAYNAATGRVSDVGRPTPGRPGTARVAATSRAEIWDPPAGVPRGSCPNPSTRCRARRRQASDPPTPERVRGARLAARRALVAAWTPTPAPPPSTTSPARCASGWSPSAGHDGDDLHARIRALVDREAAMLDAERAGRARRAASPSARSASARSSRCSPTRPSTRSWSTAPGRCGSSAAGALERDRRRVRHRGRAAPRDRADPRAARPARRRGRAAVRRPPARRLARQRRHPAAGARRPGADDPPLPPRAACRPTTSSRCGTWPAALRDFLRGAVARAAATCSSAAAPGSGKTTTLNALSAFIDADERIVTIEDAAELRLRSRTSCGSRRGPPSLEGRGEVTIRRLVRNALRMRPGPDRRRRGPRGRGARHARRDVAPATTARCRPSTPGRPRRRCGGWRRSRSWPASGCRTRRSASRSPTRSTSSSTRRARPDGAAARRRGRRGRPRGRRAGHARALPPARRSPVWRAPPADALARRLGEAA